MRAIDLCDILERNYKKGLFQCNMDSCGNKPCDLCTVEKFEIEIRAYDERRKVIGEVKTLIVARLIDNLNLTDAIKYGNKNAKQQANSYSTVMKYEIADCVDDLLEDLEQLKEQKNEMD